MIKSILKSFVFAFSGIRAAIRNERNFRIHIVAVLYVSVFSIVYGLERLEYAILFLTLYIVPAFELFNTAIEATVNLEGEKISEYAKLAKDTAAAAVLIAAVISVVVAVFLFSDIDKLLKTFLFFLNPAVLILFIISLILSLIFISGKFIGFKIKK